MAHLHTISNTAYIIQFTILIMPVYIGDMP
jgi:hypothetical protein